KTKMKKRVLTVAVAVVTSFAMLSTGVYASEGMATDPQSAGPDAVSAAEEVLLLEEGEIQPGWNADHTMYYDENLNPVKGLKTIDGKKYYFDKKGLIQFKWQKIGGFWYYFNKKEQGAAMRGVNTIGKGKNAHLYFFAEKSCKAKTKGFFKDSKGNEYYSRSEKGLLALGFQALKRGKSLNGYYFSKKNGKMAKGTTVGHLQVPKDGKLHEAYYYGIKVLNKNGWTLKAAYKYSWKTRYQGRWYRVSRSKKYCSEIYSLKGFKKRKGNCYVMAAQFYVMAKLLGYDIHQVYGKVGLPHSWTEIKNAGRKVRVYDPNFRNETGRNGWNIWYGKKGTWRYHKHGQLNKFVRKGTFE
ncbi:MAG: hypothetical protein IKF70_00020, partial [Firmicutes bacterium]|nr:hypothetical protein [Bacillota bacterium]